MATGKDTPKENVSSHLKPSTVALAHSTARSVYPHIHTQSSQTRTRCQQQLLTAKLGNSPSSRSNMSVAVD